MSDAPWMAAVAAYEAETRKERRKAEAAERRRQADAERAEFEARMAAEHASDMPAEIAAEVFRRAWDRGHAYGFGEVEIHYEDLTDFARMARSAS